MKNNDIIFEAANILIDWYRENARDLPWRRNKDPYKIWLSEIMLQQTRVSVVIPYYERFLAAFPTIDALAEAEEDTLLKLWEGLGYYSRARNLQKAARKIAAEYGGVFPCNYADIRELPGIGDYTAGAISSICFDLPEPAVDGNVLRVVSRLLEQNAPIDDSKTKRKVRDLLIRVYERTNPARRGDLTQALMEVGALVCVPNGMPNCEICPAASLCRAKLHGTVETLPVRKPKAEKRNETLTVFLLRKNGKIALRRRPETGLLAGLWEFPNASEVLNEAKAANWAERHGFAPVFVQAGRTHVHTFTHIRWHMCSYDIECGANGNPGENIVWASPEELTAKYALPSAFSVFLSDLRSEGSIYL